MIILPPGLSPKSRAVASVIDVMWADLLKRKPSLLLADETYRPRIAYLQRLAVIESQDLREKLRQSGDTYHGMPMLDFVKACDRHGFDLETFFESLNQGGRLFMLARERDESVIVGYAHDGKMHGASLLTPRWRPRRVEDFGTECHDCLAGLGLIMEIGDNSENDQYTVSWGDSAKDRLHVQKLMFPQSEFQCWNGAAELKVWEILQFNDDLCTRRIASLPDIWRSRIAGIYNARPAGSAWQ